MLLLLIIVECAEQDIGNFSSVLPISESSCCIDLIWTERVCNKMQAGEKMYEQVARHASSVIEIVSPPEETRTIKFSLCCIAYERLPVYCLFRSIGRNGILPCTDGGV